jgi:hypothetical protein
MWYKEEGGGANDASSGATLLRSNGPILFAEEHLSLGGVTNVIDIPLQHISGDHDYF